MSCNLKEDYMIESATTYKIGGMVDYAFFPETTSELKSACRFLKSERKAIIPIGNSSNVLMSSAGVNGGVVFLKYFNDLEISGTTVKVQSGVKLPFVAKNVLENELSGLEFLISVPGTIGGALRMNASAHSQALADTIVEAKVFDIDKLKSYVMSKKELELAYRSSIIQKKNLIVISATFNLKKTPKELIHNRMMENLEYRKSNQPPIHKKSAGSVFRNPNGNSAGKMLDELGAKGWREGGAIISEEHANFIINADGATSLDVLKLMKRMKSTVKKEFGYNLKPEQEYFGGFDPEEDELWQEISS